MLSTHTNISNITNNGLDSHTQFFYYLMLFSLSLSLRFTCFIASQMLFNFENANLSFHIFLSYLKYTPRNLCMSIYYSYGLNGNTNRIRISQRTDERLQIWLMTVKPFEDELVLHFNSKKYNSNCITRNRICDDYYQGLRRQPTMKILRVKGQEMNLNALDITNSVHISF